MELLRVALAVLLVLEGADSRAEQPRPAAAALEAELPGPVSADRMPEEAAAAGLPPVAAMDSADLAVAALAVHPAALHLAAR